MIHYYILDTETTGLSVDIHEINEISILRVSDGKQYSTNIKVKNPNVYNAQALEVQGKTPADLKKGLPIEEVVANVEALLAEDKQPQANRCIIAHNAPFDRKFVHKAWDRLGKEFPADLWLCTQSFGKRYVSKFNNGEKIAQAQMDAGIDISKDKNSKLKPKFGLNNFMLGVGLEPKHGAHSAIVDVQNTAVLYKWLMDTKTEYVSLIKREPQKQEKPKEQEFDIDDF